MARRAADIVARTITPSAFSVGVQTPLIVISATSSRRGLAAALTSPTPVSRFRAEPSSGGSCCSLGGRQSLVIC